MLHFETISGKTLDILRGIQAQKLGELRLVGGTALALQYGHRKSIDLDFFGKLPYETFEGLLASLKNVGHIEVMKRSKSILVFSIDGVKVDFVEYSQYPWLDSAVVSDDLVLASDKDIAAMKISAITGRGTKKDFWDLNYLLDHFSLSDILKFYKDKYHDGSEYLALKSLVYFGDAEEHEDPSPLLKISWKQIKDRVVKEHKEYMDGLGV